MYKFSSNREKNNSRGGRTRKTGNCSLMERKEEIIFLNFLQNKHIIYEIDEGFIKKNKFPQQN